MRNGRLTLEVTATASRTILTRGLRAHTEISTTLGDKSDVIVDVLLGLRS